MQALNAITAIIAMVLTLTSLGAGIRSAFTDAATTARLAGHIALVAFVAQAATCVLSIETGHPVRAALNGGTAILMIATCVIWYVTAGRREES